MGAETSTPRSRRTRKKTLVWLAVATATAAALVLGASGAFGGPSPSTFQLDGDATTQPGVSGDDWDKVFAGTSGAFSSAFIPYSQEGPSKDQTFWVQSTKVSDPISSWQWNTSDTTNDKADITDAFAAAYKSGTDTIMYFGLDRYDSSGDANVGFWFLKDPSFSLNPDGTFSGAHQNGDVFIKSEFLNGGGIANPVAYQWQNGSLQLLANGALCTSQAQTFCAIDNDGASGRPGAISVPWSYTGKNLGSGQTQIGANGFFEGGIDLAQLFDVNSLPCFTHFVAQTATSSGNSETLKDLAVGSVQSCGTIELRKHWIGTPSTATLTVKDSGGNTVASKTVSADGSTGETEVHFGTYSLSESVTNAGSYTSSLACFDDLNHNGTQDQGEPAVASGSGSVSVGIGDHVVCTYTNARNPHLTLQKVVTNDDGGTAQPTDWTLSATGGSDSFSGKGSASQDVTAGVAYTLAESGGPSGYTAGAWSCDGGSLSGNRITLAAGDNVTCTITNDDQPGTLTVVKHVVNDNGGTATAGDFTMNVTGTGADPASFPGNENGTTVTLHAGSYSVGESGPTGYTAGYSSDCQGTIALGQSKTCTVTNNDNAPSLTLVKKVVNDDGGTATADQWTLTATGPTNLSGTTPVTSGAGFAAGTYTLAENGGPSGYTAGPWHCDGGPQTGNSISLALGQNATCTVVNDDNPATLVVVKKVVNDNGGTATPGDFTMNVTGAGATPASFPGDANGTSVTLQAGSYSVGESGGPAGYAASYSADCRGTIALGETKTCTITNDDEPAHLIVVKHVVNDNGGTAHAADFSLTVDGVTASGGTTFPGAEAPGTDLTLTSVGSYSVSESGPAGYAASQSADCTGTISLGETKTCTVTNDDQAPSLKLVKNVVNDNGGTATADQWTLTATGPTRLSGTTPVQSGAGFAAGSYTLAESGGPAGYTAGDWQCVGGTQDGSTITLDLGDSAVCTITNDDNGPSLHLRKTVVNDNGGTAKATDWTLTATKAGAQTPTLSGSTPVDSTASFGSGTYTLAESGPAGYTASGWSCALTGTDTPVPVTAGAVTVGLGDNVTCTIVNDDDAPTVTVQKRLLPSTDTGTFDFSLTQGGTTQVLGNGGRGYGSGGSTGAVEVSTGSLTIGESGHGSTDASDYASSWSCSSDRGRSAEGSGTSISLTGLQLGEHVTCTFTNTHLATLIVKKVVDNSNGGGTKEPGDFTLHVQMGGVEVPGSPQPGSAAGTTYLLLPGTYTVSEDAVSGYSLTHVDGCLPDGSVTLGAGDTVTCTLTNTSAAPPPPPPPPPPAPKVDIQITKTATPNPATLGHQVTWTMVVTNNGPNNATGVTVADPVPAGMTFVSVTTSRGTCSGGELVSCQLGDLAVGSSATITLVTTATATGSITNTATTVAKEQETNTQNNTASFTVTVNGPFTPPVTYCTAVAVTPKQLLVGHRNVMTMTVSQHGQRKAGVRVRIKGSTVSVVTKRSNGHGVVKQALKPMKPGIIVFRPVATKTCKNARVGVIGVFSPPVTG